MDEGALLGLPYVHAWPANPRAYEWNPVTELHHLIPITALETKEPTP